MSNELPQATTEMCQPVITGIDKLHKAIDEYWQSKYPTYAKGRIKRMRGITPNRWPRIDKRLGCKRYSMLEEMNYILFEKTMFGITRWNRH